MASDRLRLRLAGAVVAGALLAGYGTAVWRSLDAARDGTTYSNPELAELPAVVAGAGPNLGLGLIIDDLAKAQAPTIANRGDQQYTALAPGTRVGRAPTTVRVLDLDQFPADVLTLHDHVVERRLGGLSAPGPPYELAAEGDNFRLWRRPPGELTSARRPVELPGDIGGVTVEPGRTLGLADAGWRRVRIGVRPLDGFLLPLEDYDTTGTIWRPWDAGTGHFVSIGNGGTAPLAIPVDIAVPGPYRLSVVGATAGPFRLVVDGDVELEPPVPTAVEGRDGSQYFGTVELGRGRHVVELAVGLMTVERDISFVTALSLQRETPAPPATVCVGEERFEVAWDRPLEVDAPDGSVPLVNCGDVPLFVDWVEPLAGP